MNFSDSLFLLILLTPSTKPWRPTEMYLLLAAELKLTVLSESLLKTNMNISHDSVSSATDLLEAINKVELSIMIAHTNLLLAFDLIETRSPLFN